MTRRTRGRAELALPSELPPNRLQPVASNDNDNASELHVLHKLPDVAERLGVCERTLRREIGRGTVRAVFVGALVRVSEAEVRRIVREGTGEKKRSS